MIRKIHSLSAAALLAAGTIAMSAQADSGHGDGHLLIAPDALEWGPVASMAEPAQITVIEGDLSREEPFTFRLKLPAGYRIEPHHHPAYERVTVISGTLHFAHGSEFNTDAMTRLPPGGVAIMPPGEPMFGYAETDVVMQLHGVGPWGIDYVNPEDDPRRQ